jgi:hypothetical protein
MQINTLRDEIVHIFQIPNFTTLLCQIFEGGKRSNALKSGHRLPEEWALQNMNRVLRLSPSQCIALAFALMHSNHHQLVNDARALMKAKLVEVTTFNDLNDDVIHAIVHLLSTTEVITPHYIICD